MATTLYKWLLLLILIFNVFNGMPVAASDLSNYQDKLRAAGANMLENLEVSYVYGGAKLGDEKTCDLCNECLDTKKPSPKLRFKNCPVCSQCSIDCSHFAQIVFARAGLDFPYITTTQILELAPEVLEKKYKLRLLGTNVQQIIPGDMLIYRGHVTIVESVLASDSGDIIHATGGKDIRLPGQGIQRERFVRFSTFRGDLLNIVRHSKLDQLNSNVVEGRRFKLRRVEKKTVAY